MYTHLESSFGVELSSCRVGGCRVGLHSLCLGGYFMTFCKAQFNINRNQSNVSFKIFCHASYILAAKPHERLCQS